MIENDCDFTRDNKKSVKRFYETIFRFDIEEAWQSQLNNAIRFV